MKTSENAKRVTIFIGESDKWHHQPLHTAIVRMLREEGIAGATVIKGIEGFGKNSRIHTASILRLSEDLPILLTFVDKPDRVETVMPRIDEMMGGGLVIIEDVVVYKYSDASGN